MADFFESVCRVVDCRKEPYDVYIGRPSKWGNPFKLGEDGDRKEVIDKFKQYMWLRIRSDPDGTYCALSELEGATLGCYCKPEACHGDVLVLLADLVSDLKKRQDAGEDVGDSFLLGAQKILRLP